MFSTRYNRTRQIIEIANAPGTLKFSAILSFANSIVISIPNMPAADMAVALRSLKNEPHNASVTIGVPTVKTVDIPLNKLYLATFFIDLTSYYGFCLYICGLYN